VPLALHTNPLKRPKPLKLAELYGITDEELEVVRKTLEI